MAIARDTSTEGFTTGGTTANITHVCTGTNLLLLVYAVSQSTTVTSCKYNGVSMTQLVSQLSGTDTGYIFGLVAPATGSNNIEVIRSGTTNSMIVVASSYTGVAQTGLPDGTDADSQSTTALTLSINTTAATCWAYYGAYAPSTTASAGTNATAVHSFSTNSTYDNTNFGDIPAGAFSMTVNNSPEGTLGGVMVTFAAAAAAGGGGAAPRRRFMRH